MSDTQNLFFSVSLFLLVSSSKEQVCQNGPIEPFRHFQFAGPKRPRPPSCRTIYAKNLPYDTTENAVKDYFQQFGDITSVRLARWNHTQRLKGFGYIQFETTKGVDKAMKAAKNSKVQLGGRGLILDYETAPPKRSFKTQSGRLWQKEEQRAASALQRDKSRRQKIMGK